MTQRNGLSVSAVEVAGQEREPERLPGPGPREDLALAEQTATLRRLLDAADAATARLQHLVERTTRSDAGTSRASVRLQERLRLGARMLKALQGQIDRVDVSIVDLKSQQVRADEANDALEKQFAGLEERLHRLIVESIDESRQRVETLVRDAVRRELAAAANPAAPRART